MEYILLLTACINPDGMPFTCLADVGVRKKQYIEALNFYLKNTTRKIVFVENSGTDISSSFKDFQHRIEFLCFDGNLCFDKRKGKGYGEALILEYAMAKSEFITDDVLIFKLTGRLQLININRLIHYMDKLSPYEEISAICKSSNVLLIPYLNNSQSSGVLGYAAQFNVPVFSPSSNMLGKIVRKSKLGYISSDVEILGIKTFLESCLLNKLMTIDGQEYLKLNTVNSFLNTLLN